MGWENLPRGERGEELPSKCMAKRDSSASFLDSGLFLDQLYEGPRFRG
jgi:hypothetical protein